MKRLHMVCMKHHVVNARELPASRGSEFERLAPGGPPVHRQRRAAHAMRSSLVLSDNPRWIAGNDQAEAKYEVATAIRAKHPDGVHLYHRRILNGQVESVIDILAVTPSGVWMIDVEEARGGRVEFKDRSGGRRGSYERFLVDGADYTDVLDAIDRKGGQLAAGVAEGGLVGVPITKVLCLPGANVPGGPARVRSCFLASVPQLVKLMKGGSQLSAPDIATVGLALGERFRRPRRHD